MNGFDELINQEDIPYQVYRSALLTRAKIDVYKNPTCSISGGGDSDVMLDLVSRCDDEKKVGYVFFDTGIEYEATKRHLTELEEKYDVKIQRVKALKTVPDSCREYGQPFISKVISEQIERLQNHGFKWEDRPYEELIKEYPKCKSAIRWWCSVYFPGSQFNISENKWLKEFLIENPPTFKISQKCCTHAKKKPAILFNRENRTDMEMIGVRRAEGGVRAIRYKNCFTPNTARGFDAYRPLFFWSDQDKEWYVKTFGIKHSDCYEVWGFKRTGCVGCPFNSKAEQELETARKYEPKIANAMENVFGDSYKYRQEFIAFKEKKKKEEKLNA